MNSQSQDSIWEDFNDSLKRKINDLDAQSPFDSDNFTDSEYMGEEFDLNSLVTGKIVVMKVPNRIIYFLR